jgi:hypothetical protein
MASPRIMYRVFPCSSVSSTAVGHRFPTAAARVRAQVRSCVICNGEKRTRAGFLRVLRFSLPILIPLTTPNLLSTIIRDRYNRRISGRRTKRTQPHPAQRNPQKNGRKYVALFHDHSVATGPFCALCLEYSNNELCIVVTSNTAEEYITPFDNVVYLKN